MATGFRVTARSGAVIGEADSMDGVIAIAKNIPPGRYRIEQLSLDPATGDIRCSSWGRDRQGPQGSDQVAPPVLDRLMTSASELD